MPRYYALFKLYDPKYPNRALVYGTAEQLARLKNRGNFGELERFISRDEALSRLLTSSRHDMRVICPITRRHK